MRKARLIVLCAAGLTFAQAPAANPVPPITDAQREVLKKVLTAGEAEAKGKVQPSAENLASLAKDINRSVLSDKVDEALVTKLRAELLDTAVGLVKPAVDMKLSTVSELGKVLTPEQKKFLLTELEKPGAPSDLTELVQKKLIETKK